MTRSIDERAVTSGAVADTLAWLRPRLAGFRPCVAIILGSGLGAAVRAIEGRAAFAFDEVPGFLPPAVPGHAGRLLVGTWAGRAVLVFRGRVHHYEGHDWSAVTHAVRVAGQLWCRGLVLTNASGGIRSGYEPGQLVRLTDHLNLQGSGPFLPVTHSSHPAARSRGLTAHGSRPHPYCAALGRQLDAAAERAGVTLDHGVYAAVSGPNYETPAEVRLLRTLGADLVGMSTVSEALTARQAGMRVAALSCVANAAAGLGTGAIDHDDVVRGVARGAADLGRLLTAFLADEETSRLLVG